MQEIKKIYKEVKNDFIKAKLLLVSLESIIVFLIAYAVIFFVPIPLTYKNIIIPGGLAILYFIIFMIVASSKYSIPEAQKRIKELDEILATAKEYEHDPSIPAQATREELIVRARKASSIPLLQFGKLYRRFGSLFVLLILIAIIPFLNMGYTLADVIPLENIPLFNVSRAELSADNVTLLDDEGLYGNASSFSATGERIEITVDLTHSGGDYDNPLAWDNDITGDSRGSSLFADAQIENPAIEELPEEIELAKAYNLKIRQMR